MESSTLEVASFCTDDCAKNALVHQRHHTYIKLLDGCLKSNNMRIEDDTFIVFKSKNCYCINVIVRLKLSCPVRRIRVSIYNVSHDGTQGPLRGPTSKDLATQDVEGFNESRISFSGVFPDGNDASSRIAIRVHVSPPAGGQNVGIEHISLRGCVLKTKLYDELMEATERDAETEPRSIPSSDGKYEWKCNVIPWKAGHKPHGTPDHNGYKKFDSVQATVLFYLGLDKEKLRPDDPQLSLFITNYENRGPDNYRKKMYMTALTTSVMHHYNDKINAFMNEVYASITTYNKPVLSSFKHALLRFFLCIHVGYDCYPDYVMEYFSTFMDIVAYGDPQRPGRDEAMIFGYKTSFKVREYFEKRDAIVRQTQDKSSIIYYWGQAGLHVHVLIQEAIHNIVAFFQYLNLLYLLITDSIQGTVVPFDPGHHKYNFFAKFRDARSDADRLDVVREAYRLLVPNGVSPSHVEQYHYDGSDIRSRHIHRDIMVASHENPKDYYEYNTHQYKDFHTDLKPSCMRDDTHKNHAMCDYNPCEMFKKSFIDDETLLDKRNEKIVPVFKTPKYMPFGLGYRRCAGEVLNYFITVKLMHRLCEVKFMHKDCDAPIVTIAPFTAKPDNIYVHTHV